MFKDAMRFLLNRKKVYAFNGVYKNLDFPASKSFYTQEGVDWAIDKAKIQIKNIGQELQLVEVAKLNIMINLLIKDNPVTIYDVGGGAGHTYYNICANLCEKNNLIWKIYEQTEVVKLFGDFIKSNKFPIAISSIDKLRSDLKKQKDSIRVLHMRSVLQYISNPFQFLKKIMPYMDYVFLCRLPASNVIPTFVTRECAYSAQLSFIFFNLLEIEEFLKSNNFKILEAWNELQKFPMGNFPKKYQLDHCRGILAVNKEKGK